MLRLAIASSLLTTLSAIEQHATEFIMGVQPFAYRWDIKKDIVPALAWKSQCNSDFVEWIVRLKETVAHIPSMKVTQGRGRKKSAVNLELDPADDGIRVARAGLLAILEQGISNLPQTVEPPVADPFSNLVEVGVQGLKRIVSTLYDASQTNSILGAVASMAGVSIYPPHAGDTSNFNISIPYLTMVEWGEAGAGNARGVVSADTFNTAMSHKLTTLFDSTVVTPRNEVGRCVISRSQLWKPS